MKTSVIWKQIKRFSALAAVALSILFLLVSLGGIVGVWLLRGQANRIVNSLFTAADASVASTSAKIDEMITRRQELRSGLDELSNEIEKLGSKVNQTPVVFMAIDELMNGKLSSALQKLDQSGRRLYGELARLEAAATTLNSTFLFRSQDGALDDLSATLTGLLDDLQQMDQDFQELETRLRERKADSVQTLVESAQSSLDPMYARLTRSETRLTNFRGKLDNLQARLETARMGIVGTINLVTIILTAVLAWLAVSQVLAARYAWEVYRSKSRPADHNEATFDSVPQPD